MDERRTCDNPQRFRELISAYIDGDLEPADRQILLAHLATCDECRATLDSYRHIGSQLRNLPPVVPPVELREDIFAATVDSGPRRLYVFGSRVGYSVAALAAVLLIFIVAIYLIVNGYQRSIDPEIVASQPSGNVIWPLSRPIEITFNKEMDRASVESALSISPASERERLTKTWNGNTLVLGANQTLRPDTTYSISITTAAEDRWGTNLGAEFKLQFESSDSFALQTPEPIPSPTPSPTERPSPTATPSQGEVTSTREAIAPPTTTAGPPAATDDTEPEQTAEPPTATEGESESPGGSEDPGEAPEPPAPTPTERDPEPEPTSTPEPTATERPLPTATPSPTTTPRPSPTATPTSVPPTATPEPPAPTATPDTVPVVGAFGNVYWSIEIVATRLGAPVEAARTMPAVELDFQHGAMFGRDDTAQTYVLESGTGFWSVVPSSSDSAESEPGPAEGTWVPGGSLGALWAAESWIQSSLGHALAPAGQSFDSRIQTFEHGRMLMSATGQIYVLYDDATWELYPDPGA